MTPSPTLPKVPTGVPGLDDLTDGGLPRGMVTVIVGGPGTGKTLLATATALNGADRFDEPAVIVSFEQPVADFERTVASAGMDLAGMRERNLVEVVGVRPESLQADVTGPFTFDAIFQRIEAAIQRVGAKRVVVDTIDALLTAGAGDGRERQAYDDLLARLRSLALTTVITAQDAADGPAANRLVQYLADCVIQLELALHERHASRSLRVMKYRGSQHVGDAVSFMIDASGPATMPTAFAALSEVEVGEDRLSSGIPELDRMLGGYGYYRPSTVMITGGAGTGKTSLASHFARATADGGGTALYVTFEEPPTQLLRNMRSIGLDLGPHMEADRIRVDAVRPGELGLEQHLVRWLRLVDQLRPTAVVLDPVTALHALAPEYDVTAMLTRFVDLLHARGATGVFTGLTSGQMDEGVGMSSLVDTWLHVRNVESFGERNRTLYVRKSRGMAHTNQVREFRMSDDGVHLLDILTVGDRVVTGAARAVEQQRTAAEVATRQRERATLRSALDQAGAALEAQLASVRAAYELERQELNARLARLDAEEDVAAAERSAGIVGRSTSPEHAEHAEAADGNDRG